MPVIAVIGAQWGDEGKGKIVDLLSAKADVIVRSQGGANAGHTIYKNDQKIILHLMPSGVLTPETQCLIGPGVVLDPDIFAREVAALQDLGIDLQGRLLIDYRTHLVVPTHKLIDQYQEEVRGGSKIGTTSRGIGPTYADKSARRGIRVGELINHRMRDQVCNDLYDYHAHLIEKVYEKEMPNRAEFLQQCEQWADMLVPYASDAVMSLQQAVEKQKMIILEGAQGAYLDIDLGTYPFVTSSHPGIGGAVMGIGLPFRKVDYVLGVLKAYCTRVGSGPFPTEMDEESAERLRARGAEYGSTTGRPRRCGWLDLPAAKQAAYWNSIDGWAVTKLDVLDGQDVLRAAIGYQIRGRVINGVPATRQAWDEVEPVYAGLKPWRNSRDKTTYESLAAETIDYIDTIEKFTGTPVRIISNGAEQQATIMTHGDLI